MALERQIQSACDGEFSATSAAAHAEAGAFFAAPRNATVSFHHCRLSQSEPMKDMFTLEAILTLGVLADTLRRLLTGGVEAVRLTAPAQALQGGSTRCQP